MTCPECNSENVYVKDTIPGTDGKVYRRRHCRDCNVLFRTMESCMEDTEESRAEYAEAVRNKSPMIKKYYEEKGK